MNILRNMLTGLTALIFVSSLQAELVPFRIGTGGSDGTYHPIGSLIAQGIGDSRSQSQRATALSDVVVLAQRSNGSAANVSDIGAGLLEAGLAQADVIHWAYHGAGPFAGEEPITGLRTIATLYLESLHLIVRAESDITDIKNIVGKRVSIDEVGSGTQLNAGFLLSSLGIDIGEIQAVYLKATDAIERLRRKELDAFFVVAGYPVAGVSELVAEGVGRVVPIPVSDIRSLFGEYPFFTVDLLPRNTYGNTVEIETLAVPAQLVVDARLDDELVYQVTSLLWSREILDLLAAGHAKGSELHFESALVGLSAPLHPGAERYYRERSHHYFTTGYK